MSRGISFLIPVLPEVSGKEALVGSEAEQEVGVLAGGGRGARPGEAPLDMELTCLLGV